MTKVSIIGGGRWAKTIAGVLAGLSVPPERILLHSRHNAEAVRAWIAERNLAAHIGVVETWPDYRGSLPDAMIVANPARDHVMAAIPALTARVPVLVEKPMAVGQSAIAALCEVAESAPALLAASNVLLFARYLDAFADAVGKGGPVRQVELVWQDGAGDVMRGDVKSYDPSVSVFDDVLPHVVPIIGRMCGPRLSFTGLQVAEGGAQVDIGADANGVPVRMHLARNANHRRRQLTAHTDSGTYALDFSDEPGTITGPDNKDLNGDPLWNGAVRPLGSMLTAFLAAVRGSALDPRLFPDKALASAIFADAVRAPYRLQRGKWAAEHNVYALQEISSEI